MLGERGSVAAIELLAAITPQAYRFVKTTGSLPPGKTSDSCRSLQISTKNVTPFISFFGSPTLGRPSSARPNSPNFGRPSSTRPTHILPRAVGLFITWSHPLPFVCICTASTIFVRLKKGRGKELLVAHCKIVIVHVGGTPSASFSQSSVLEPSQPAECDSPSPLRGEGRGEGCFRFRAHRK
jgi:hypothetical protein